MRTALLTLDRSHLQDTGVDAAQGLGLQFNTLGPWSPCLPYQLAPGEPLWVKFTGVADRSCDMYRGTVTETSATAAQLKFRSHQGEEHFTLRDSGEQEFVLHPPVVSVQPIVFQHPDLAAPRFLDTP